MSAQRAKGTRWESEVVRALHDAGFEAPEPDQTRCDHTWPSELDDSAVCQTCGLPYAEWSR